MSKKHKKTELDRVDNLRKALAATAEVMATGDVLGALNRMDKWQEVVKSICCHHVTHKEKWKEKRK